MKHAYGLLALAAALPIAATTVQTTTAKPRVSFNAEIAPLFRANCLGCHGVESPAAGLNLTSTKSIARVVVPHNPGASVLVHSLRGIKGKNLMPKGFPALAPAQVELVSRWISEGAHFTDPVDFATEVQPILKAACYSCHSDDPKAGLDLRDAKQLLAQLSPGNAEKSNLFRRVMGYDGKPQMPRGFPALLPAQSDTLRRWINEGASFAAQARAKPKHWAYRPLTMPAVPKVAGVTQPIDAFVRQRLATEKLAPSPAADRYTLLRRVSLDITGLPPSPADIREFLRDTSPGAYEKVVDRLLASPQYGVRQARPWLDLARYADSNGFEKDESRVIWPWRDWVVNALNANMPYNQFAIEQLAGDLLPNATQEQRIATGFNRNTMQNMEGGVDEGEAMYNVLIDRVNTTATAFMGSTMACTRCHDHKFDPLTQKDYFAMYAYFNKPNVRKVGEGFEETWYEDELPVYQPGQREAIEKLRAARQAETNPDRARQLDAQIRQAEQAVVKTLVMRDDPSIGIPKTYIKRRGEYKGDSVPVQPATPATFGATPAGLPKNRLGLARWLVSPQNPMAARVHVNRIWEQVFGRGIVETTEDFGTRASDPSHPELLEWLAADFVRGGWDQKRLLKTIVMSATYRQSSRVSPSALEHDPQNVLLARGPRFRMEAEMIRDTALFSAGLLSLKRGGPSVMPHQPDGVWNTPYSGETWRQSTGADLYRRGLYTFAKRTSPYPSFGTFDAPSREECTIRRIRTNTPMQALALMNDPMMVQASRALGARMAGTAGSIEHKLGTGMLWALSRPARTDEIASLRRLLTDLKGDWSVVASVILNLDEAITKS
ncbi:MAG: DUF1553 domain-containing protein [Chthonomonas sp.]|nr:DUF1553 domain-containing protein [Chthonomonas sp.]